jgi:hypothetical protein
MIFKQTITMILLALLCEFTSAQSKPRPKYFDHALIEHTGHSIILTANDSAPLFQAIDALRLEFGWQINRESAPCFSHLEIVDDTDPKWRAANPDKKGVTRPVGGMFIATLAEPKEVSDSTSEHQVLSQLVEQYNATENPGKYVLRVDSERQFTIIGDRIKDEAGSLVNVSPLLDTPVLLAKTSRSAYAAIESVLGALRSATGKTILFADPSTSLFVNTTVTIGGKAAPARELLRQVLASTNYSLQYDLSFDPDVPVYLLSTSPVVREEDDGNGGRQLVPVSRPMPKSID